MSRKRPPSEPITRRLVSLERKVDRLAEVQKAAPPNAWHRTAHAIENFGPTRIMAAAGVWLLVFTLASFWFDFSNRSEERAARAEEAKFRQLSQVATAWNVVLTKASGDVGKGNSLNTILSSQQQLVDVDFSCENIGVFVDGKCIGRPHFHHVVLGDNDFWQDDPERISCISTEFCRVIPYLKNARFDGAKMNNLHAEKLFLDEHFDGVTGVDWVVRNADFQRRRLPRMAGRPEFTHNAAVMSCADCFFVDSNLSYRTFKGMVRSILRDVVVWISPPDQLGSGAELAFHTYLDAPVLFRRDKIVTSKAATLDHTNQVGDETHRLMVSKSVVWPLYEKAKYCVSKADFAVLEQHIREVDRAKTKLRRGDNAQRLLEAKRGSPEHKRAQRNRALYSKLEEEGITYTFSETAHPIAHLKLGATAPKPGKTQYNCRFSFDQVKPMLTDRVIQAADWRVKI